MENKHGLPNTNITKITRNISYAEQTLFNGELSVSLQTMSKENTFAQCDNSSPNLENDILKKHIVGAKSNEYMIVNEVGSGGMGVIYKAFEKNLQRCIAIKKIHNSQKTQKIYSEALLHASLDHPNINPIYELIETIDKELILTMKLINGSKWSELLEENKKISQEKYNEKNCLPHFETLISVCNAVSFAHKRNIIHNDLKPDNIMLEEDDVVFVMDWGIAVSIDHPQNIKNHILHKSTITKPTGTMCYASPELVEGNGNAIGVWTDIYLLGAILHQIITHYPPHQGNTVDDIMLKAYESKPPLFEGLDVPEGLQKICRKALAREPQERYDSVKNFQYELQYYLKNRESVECTKKGYDILSRCKNGLIKPTEQYLKFQEARANFETALNINPEYEEAKKGKYKAQFAYIDFAIENNDLELAFAQIEDIRKETTSNKKVNRYLETVLQKKEHIRREEKNKKLIKRSLFAAITFIFIGLIIGFWIVNEQKLAAQIAEKYALQQKNKKEESLLVFDKKLQESRMTLMRGYFLENEVAYKLGQNFTALDKITKSYENLCDIQNSAHTNEYLSKMNAILQYNLFPILPQKTAHFTVAFSPFTSFSNKARIFAWAGGDKIYFWKFPQNGTEIFPDHKAFTMLPYHKGHIYISHSGKWFVAEQNEHICVYDMTTMKIIYKHPIPGENINNITISDDDSSVAVRTSLGVYYSRLETDTWDLLWKEKQHSGSLYLSNNGNILVSSSQLEMQLWDTQKRKKKKQLSYLIHDVTSCCLSPDNSVLVYGDIQGKIYYYYLKEDVHMVFSGHESKINDICFSNDGRFFATSADNCKLWNTQNQQVLNVFDAQKCYGFSENNEQLFTAREDKGWQWEQWHLEPYLVEKLPYGQDLKQFFKSLNRVQQAQTVFSHPSIISPSKRFIVVVTPISLHVWDQHKKTTKSIFLSYTGKLHSVKFSPDEKYLIVFSSGGKILIYNSETSEIFDTIEVGGRKKNDFAFSPDGKYLLYGRSISSSTTNIMVRDIEKKQDIKILTSVNFDILCLEISPDQKWLAIGQRNNLYTLCELALKNNIYEKTSSVDLQLNAWSNLLTWHPSSKKIACANDNIVTIYTYENNIWQLQKELSFSQNVEKILFTTDKTFLLIFSTSSIILYHLEHEFSLQIFRGYLNSGGFSCSNDQKMWIIPLTKEALIWELPNYNLESLSFEEFEKSLHKKYH